MGKKPSPAVSIIMNCLNNEKYLKEAIDSVYAQTFKDWEIIFWDDASTDKSGEIARSYDDKLKYFRSDRAFPLGCVRNLALGKAHGKYIAFLDCDDIWLPEKLEKQTSILERHPDASLLYSNYFLMKGGRKILALCGQEPQGHVFGRFLYHYPVAVLTTMFRKEALDGLGDFFDENLSLAEDFDFFMRMLYKSRAVYQADPTAIYRVHSEMSSIKLLDRWSDEMKYVIKKFEGFAKDSRSALNKRKLDIEYLDAKLYMEQGDAISARRKIEPIKFRSLKYLAMYLFSHMPARFWRFVALNFMKNPI